MIVPLSVCRTLDVERVRSAAGGDALFEREIFAVYLEDTSLQIAALESEQAEGHWPSVARFAHSIKDASGNVGAMRMQQLARVIEHNAATQSCADIEPLVRDLLCEFNNLRRAIVEYFHNAS